MKKTLCPIKPVGKYLFVKRLAAKTVSAGGILLPDDAQEKPQYGKVLAVGPEVETTQIDAGDVVVFGKYAGADIDVLDKEPLVMLEQDEVVGVVIDRKLIQDLES